MIRLQVLDLPDHLLRREDLVDQQQAPDDAAEVAKVAGRLKDPRQARRWLNLSRELARRQALMVPARVLATLWRTLPRSTVATVTAIGLARQQ